MRAQRHVCSPHDRLEQYPIEWIFTKSFFLVCCSLILHPFKYFLRIALLSLLLLYFAAAATLLTVRYWALPRINDWRPLIEQHLSEAVGAKVSIEDISADWSGFNPTVKVRNLKLRDTTDQLLVQVPEAFAIVSYKSLFELDLRLAHLEINGIALAGTRHPDGSVWLAGQRLAAHSNQPLKLDRDTLAVRWLLHQGEIFVRQASFLWHDQLRQAPALSLSKIDISLVNSVFRHELRLVASLPQAVGQRVELVIKTENVFSQLTAQSKREAEIFFEVQDTHLTELAPWLDLPSVSGTIAARLWVDVQQGMLGQATLEVSGKQLALPLLGQGQGAAFAQTGQVRLSGWLGDLLPEDRWPLLARSAAHQGMSLSATTTGLAIDSPLFAPSLLELGEVTARAKLSKTSAGLLSVNAAQLDLKAAEIAAQVQGSWLAGGLTGAGVLDLTATIAKAPVNRLHQYVTTLTDPDARAFLRKALTQGQLSQVALTLKGDLAQFPFNAPDAPGVFRLEGQYRGLTVDYDPSLPGKPSWPLLEQAQGQVVLDKLSLKLNAASGRLLDTQGKTLAVQNLVATVPDLQWQPKLSLEAVLSGEAKDYLSVLRQAPLPSEFASTLKRLEATGLLTVPLSIELALDSDQTPQAKGQVQVSGGTLSLGKEFPPLENIRGAIDFSMQQLRTESLRVQFLGGESVLSGSWGEAAQRLQAQGTVSAVGLSQLLGTQASLPLTGQARYDAQLVPTKQKGYAATLTSTLEGLAVNLPAPLGKAAQGRMPLTLQWSALPVKTEFLQSVSFSLGDLLKARFERPANARPSPYFTRAAIVMGEFAQLPRSGLLLDLNLGKIDVKDWAALFDQVTQEPKRASTGDLRVFPPLASARLRSPHLLWSDLSFTELDVTAMQSAPEQWTARISSKEALGTATWSAAGGALDGRIRARFSKLSLGAPANGQTEVLKIDVIEKQQWSDIPAIDLTIDDLTLFGSQLGSLRLQGSSQQRPELWNIETLDLRSAAATTTATGQWRLKGPERGVRLNTEIVVNDLGRFSEQMGQPDRVKGGHGSIQAQINWVNFPWLNSYQGLNGTAKIDFKQGVFEHVNSRSARLLELLSLQSLQRLLSFNFRPGNEFKDGFPWNALTGSFDIKNGLVHTDDLTVNSPVASIVLTGTSDLDKKIWDMQADVRPMFDMSGAALATAFVVNPIAGLSALVTQFLLRNPIEKAMTVKYSVTGHWDEPKLELKGAPEPAPVSNRGPAPSGN